MRLLPALALLVLAGCLGVGAEGEETLVFRNEAREPLAVRLQIVQAEGGFPVFDERLSLAPGESAERALALRAGEPRARVDSTHGVHERMSFPVPSHGDSVLELVVRDAGASLGVRGA